MGSKKNKMMEDEFQESQNEEKKQSNYLNVLLAQGKYSGYDCPNCGAHLSKEEYTENICPKCSCQLPWTKD